MERQGKIWSQGHMSKLRLSLSLLTIFPMTGLFAYAYLGNFTRMLADDFCSIYFADRLGLLRSIWYWYLNWSGRYTAFAADWLILHSILGPYKLHYIVPAVILLWLTFATFALYLFLHKRHELAFLHSIALAGSFLFLVLMLSPDVPQSLFWWNGMRSYSLPLVMLTFYVLLFQLDHKYLKIKPAASRAITFVLFLLSGGLGETIAVAQTVFCLVLLSFQLLNSSNGHRAELSIPFYALVGALASLMLVILSPGNSIRQALLPPPPDIAALISISLMAYAAFIGSFFLEPAKIIGLTGAILLAIWIGGHYRDLLPARRTLIPACAAGGLIVSFACFPPGVFGYSEPPPARVLVIPVYFLIGGILCTGFLLGGWLADRHDPVWLGSTALLLSINLLLGVSTVGTVSRLYGERHAYIDFAEKWDRVDAQILQAKADHLEVVQIPAMDNWAGLERPTDNENYWPTLCYSRHYGIRVVGPPYSE